MTAEIKRINVAKRVFAYLVDSFVISLFTLSVTLLTRSPLGSAAANVAAFLLRDVATPAGSVGKRVAGLSLEVPDATLARRVNASVLRNLPFGLPLLFYCFDADPSSLEQFVFTAVFFVVLVTELWRLFSANGVRYGDKLAGVTVLDPRPEESRAKYVGLAFLMILLSAALQVFASLYLFKGLADN